MSSQTAVPTTLRVLLAEGDAAVRDALTQLVLALPNVELVGAEARAGDAILLAFQTKPDVILLDLTPPDRDAVDTIHHLLRACPGISIVMLVDSSEDARLTPALDAGARDSALKAVSPERLDALLRRLGPNPFSAESPPSEEMQGQPGVRSGNDPH